MTTIVLREEMPGWFVSGDEQAVKIATAIGLPTMRSDGNAAVCLPNNLMHYYEATAKAANITLQVGGV